MKIGTIAPPTISDYAHCTLNNFVWQFVPYTKQTLVLLVFLFKNEREAITWTILKPHTWVKISFLSSLDLLFFMAGIRFAIDQQSTAMKRTPQIGSVNNAYAVNL